MTFKYLIQHLQNNLEVSRLGKASSLYAALKKKKLSANSFLLHVLCVYHGLRDGYLVDSFAIDINLAQLIITILSSFHSSSLFNLIDIKDKVCIVSLGDEVLFVSIHNLQVKFTENYWESIELITTLPYIIGIDTDSLVLISTYIHSFALSSLKELLGYNINPQRTPDADIISHVLSIDDLSDLYSTSCPTKASVLTRILGYPLIAGFLIGYPSLYHSSTNSLSDLIQLFDSENNNNNNKATTLCPFQEATNPLPVIPAAALGHALGLGNALYAQRLKKYSVILPISISTTATALRMTEIDIMEFTIPVLVLEEHEGMDVQVVEYINQRILNRINSSSCIRSDPFEGEAFLKTEEFLATSVVM